MRSTYKVITRPGLTLGLGQAGTACLSYDTTPIYCIKISDILKSFGKKLTKLPQDIAYESTLSETVFCLVIKMSSDHTEEENIDSLSLSAATSNTPMGS